jgi:hypothetical protein
MTPPEREKYRGSANPQERKTVSKTAECKSLERSTRSRTATTNKSQAKNYKLYSNALVEFLMLSVAVLDME